MAVRRSPTRRFDAGPGRSGAAAGAQLHGVSGTKYHDLNANGNQDAGEPGLTRASGSGRTMTTTACVDANEPFDDTDANGDYVIANINPPDGDYSLREKLTPRARARTAGSARSRSTTIANGPVPVRCT